MIAVPIAGRKRLVIVGATGMVGGYALRNALAHPAVGRVTAIDVAVRDASERTSSVFENRDIRAMSRRPKRARKW